MTFSCDLLGPVIAAIVAGLKRVPKVGPLVDRYPKIVAALISAGAAGLATYTGRNGGGLQLALRCAVEYFATAVATHEVVKSATKPPDPPATPRPPPPPKPPAPPARPTEPIPGYH